MTRISLDPPSSLFLRLTEWYSRRTYGAVLDPGAAIAHNPPVLWTYIRYEQSLAKWDRLDPTLKALAVMSSATMIGCSWCLDFGFWESTTRGLAPAKLRDVPRWRDSDRFTELERQVMAYAEAMTTTPLEMTDDIVAELRTRLDDAELVELTMMISVENSRSRFNSALGLNSQGFRNRCEISTR